MRTLLKLLAATAALIFALILPFEVVSAGEMHEYEAFRIDEIRDGASGYTHPRFLRMRDDGQCFFSTANGSVTPVRSTAEPAHGFTMKVVTTTDVELGVVLDEGMMDPTLKRPWQYTGETMGKTGWTSIDFFLYKGKRYTQLPKEFIRSPVGTVSDLAGGKKLTDGRSSYWVSAKSLSWFSNGCFIATYAGLFTERFVDRDGLAAKLTMSSDGLRFDFDGVTAGYVMETREPDNTWLAATKLFLRGKSLILPPDENRRKVGKWRDIVTADFSGRIYFSVLDWEMRADGEMMGPTTIRYSDSSFTDHAGLAVVEASWNSSVDGPVLWLFVPGDTAGGRRPLGNQRATSANAERPSGAAPWVPIWFWARNAPRPNTGSVK